MNNESKYKALFFKFIYWYLQLSVVEDKFLKKGINKIEFNGDAEIKSDYFYLLNEVDLSRLDKNELDILQNFNLENIDKNELSKFIMKTYSKVFFKEYDQKFKYYGPMSMAYRVPSDCIALGCCFDRYGYFNGNKLKYDEINSNYQYLCNMLNYLQFDANSKIKVAFVLYDEFYGKIEDRFVK